MKSEKVRTWRKKADGRRDEGKDSMKKDGRERKAVKH